MGTSGICWMWKENSRIDGGPSHISSFVSFRRTYVEIVESPFLASSLGFLRSLLFRADWPRFMWFEDIIGQVEARTSQHPIME